MCQYHLKHKSCPLGSAKKCRVPGSGSNMQQTLRRKPPVRSRLPPDQPICDVLPVIFIWVTERAEGDTVTWEFAQSVSSLGQQAY